MKDLTVIIPAKFESENLSKVIQEIEKLGLNYFIVLRKEDLATIDVIKNKNNIIFQDNCGFGDAIILGINNVKTKYFATMFADGSTNPKELSLLLNCLQNTNSDFVFGSRYLKNASSQDDTILSYIGNKIFSLLGNLFFGLIISDILYTFIVGKTDKAKKLNLTSSDYAVCVELPISANRLGFKIVDYPCHEKKRLFGKRKVNYFFDGFKILIKMVKMFFNR
jgi:glycosyltransferase involved in cell wall biosynthesis